MQDYYLPILGKTSISLITISLVIDHNFIGELRNLQVHPAVIKWIKSFLAGREQIKCKTRNGIFFLEESGRWPTLGH
jgi:hypothetical protein